MKEENKSDNNVSEHSTVESENREPNLPPTNAEYNSDLKERIEEKRNGKLIKYDDLPIKAKLFADWMKSIARYGNAESIFIIFKYEHDECDERYGCVFYTDSHKYHISIRLPKDTDTFKGGYAGCTASTRKSRVGEDWNRGSDLPDGKYTQETFDKISRGIIGYEMKTLQLWRK